MVFSGLLAAKAGISAASRLGADLAAGRLAAGLPVPAVAGFGAGGDAAVVAAAADAAAAAAGASPPSGLGV